jgi:steroid delta-isomerase-like uncharacterized protein
MTTEEIRAFCVRYARAWERGDVPGLLACYTDDCEIASPIFSLLRGRSELETSLRSLFSAFADFQVEVDDVVVDCEHRERAVLLFTSFVTHRGEIFGLPGTGRRVEVRGAFVFTFDGDRIAKDMRMYDFTGMLMQLGVLRARTA